MNEKKLAIANTALRFALTKKSELNLNDKGAFPQVCIDVLCEATYIYAV